MRRKPVTITPSLTRDILDRVAAGETAALITASLKVPESVVYRVIRASRPEATAEQRATIREMAAAGKDSAAIAAVVDLPKKVVAGLMKVRVTTVDDPHVVRAVADRLERGETYGQIAYALSMTEGQVSGLVQRRGLRRAPPPKIGADHPDLARVVAERQAGTRLDVIASMFGLSRQSVRDLLRAAGIDDGAASPERGPGFVKRDLAGLAANEAHHAAKLAATDAAAKPRHVSLFDLGPRQCHFPTIEVAAMPAQRYCGGDCAEGETYCPVHRRLMYAAPAVRAAEPGRPFRLQSLQARRAA